MTPRKQPALETSRAPRARLPLAPVRQEIWEAACDLMVSGQQQEFSAIVAARFHTSERVINSVLLLEGMRHERRAAALRMGVLNALEISREVGESVDELSESLGQTA